MIMLTIIGVARVIGGQGQATSTITIPIPTSTCITYLDEVSCEDICSSVSETGHPSPSYLRAKSAKKAGTETSSTM
eukprot:scaffold9446_cov72-Skeletonema_dohrnii-CCMP3373.AAC.9